MKPNGVSLAVSGHGIRMAVYSPTGVEDRVWLAVQEAMLAGWTPKQFMVEARAAWEHELKEKAKEELAAFRRDEP